MLAWSAGSVLAAVAAVLAAAYVYSVCVALSYWKRKGVPHSPPLPFVGNFGPLLLKKNNLPGAFRSLTIPFKDHGYCGMYQWHSPVLLVWDPDIAKQILTKDFSSFHDRGQPFDEKNDPLSAHLVNLEGPRWRNLRNKLSPTFTSGKLKLMYPLMKDVSDVLVDTIRKEINDGESEVDMKELLGRFATDVIGTVTFGIECNSLQNKNNEFLFMTQEIFTSNIGLLARFFLQTIHPRLASLIPFKFVISRSTNFFLSLMRDTLEYRKKNNIKRNDFVQLIMQLQEDDRSQKDRVNHIEMTHNVMTAQGFVFFVAGLDNVSNSIGFCLQQLAFNPDLQRRAAEEVRAVCKEHGGEMTYEALKEMDLLDRIIKEGLRLWTPVGFLTRKCNQKTVLGNLVVEKGQMVTIVTETMHKDPDLFPEPLKFDPDRFTKEAAEARHPYAFLPFGEGPRICIAERFAMLEMKLPLAALINSFEFSPGPKTEETPEINKACFTKQPLNGFWLHVEERV